MRRSAMDTSSVAMLNRRGPLRRALATAIGKFSRPSPAHGARRFMAEIEPSHLGLPAVPLGADVSRWSGESPTRQAGGSWRGAATARRGEIVVSNEQAALLDQELDRQMTAMIQAADRLDVERMAAQSHAFVRALRANAIVAADFEA